MLGQLGLGDDGCALLQDFGAVGANESCCRDCVASDWHVEAGDTSVLDCLDQLVHSQLATPTGSRGVVEFLAEHDEELVHKPHACVQSTEHNLGEGDWEDADNVCPHLLPLGVLKQMAAVLVTTTPGAE